MPLDERYRELRIYEQPEGYKPQSRRVGAEMHSSLRGLSVSASLRRSSLPLMHMKSYARNKAMSEGHNTDEDIKHEVESINLKPLVMSLVYLALGTAAVAALMYVMFNYLKEREVASDPHRSPLADERPALPPAPRLQLAPSQKGQTAPDLKEHPLEELKRMREEENSKIASYGWVDENAGIARIPISRAKELLFEKGGLPVRPPSREILEALMEASGKVPAESAPQTPAPKPAEKKPEGHQ